MTDAQVIVEADGQSESTQSADALFNSLRQFSIEVEGLRQKYISNKSASTKLRNVLMEIAKCCTELRKVVLDAKKVIPVKPRQKKIKDSDMSTKLDDTVVEQTQSDSVIPVKVEDMLPIVNIQVEKKAKAPRRSKLK